LGDLIIAHTDLSRQSSGSEEELRKALIEAECDNQAKAAFLVTVSHELRAPLNAIVGSANMLAEQIYGPLGSENIINTPVPIKFT
jgi:signal transduction histidine kinase